MTVYATTESKQLWQHPSSGQVLFLDAIAPLDETDESAEYRYSSQGCDMGFDSDFIAQGWVKIDMSFYVGMPDRKKQALLDSQDIDSVNNKGIFEGSIRPDGKDPFTGLRESLEKDRENLTPDQQKRLEYAKSLSAQFPIRARHSKTQHC